MLIHYFKAAQLFWFAGILNTANIFHYHFNSSCSQGTTIA